MTTTNLCEGCNMCCKVYRIPELNKPRDVWCDHCEVGVGCKRYADRPDTCSGFECFWLQAKKRGGDVEPLPDAMRPDRSKVVIAASTDGLTFVATCALGEHTAWRKADVLVWLHRLANLSKLAGGAGIVAIDVEPYAYVVTASGHVMRAKDRSPVQEDGSRNIAELIPAGTIPSGLTPSDGGSAANPAPALPKGAV